jgi:hypothetical protein
LPVFWLPLLEPLKSAAREREARRAKQRGGAAQHTDGSREPTRHGYSPSVQWIATFGEHLAQVVAAVELEPGRDRGDRGGVRRVARRPEADVLEHLLHLALRERAAVRHLGTETLRPESAAGSAGCQPSAAFWPWRHRLIQLSSVVMWPPGNTPVLIAYFPCT